MNYNEFPSYKSFFMKIVIECTKNFKHTKNAVLVCSSIIFGKTRKIAQNEKMKDATIVSEGSSCVNK